MTTSDPSPRTRTHRKPMGKTLARLAALVLVAGLLAGCFGYPEGSARPGDSVTVRYTATDAATGQVLARDQTVQFAIGSGESGLGESFERAAIGKRANETLAVDSASTERAGAEVLERDALLGDYNRTQAIDTADLAGFFRKRVEDIQVGFVFGYSQLHNGTVTAMDATTSTVVLSARTPREEYPELGLAMVADGDATRAIERLEPLVGTKFTLPRPLEALELPAGTYESLAMKDGKLRFARSLGDARLEGKDLHITATVVAVREGPAPKYDPDGNAGVRNSPQVLRKPTAASTTTSAAPTGDGHDHEH